MNPVFAENEAPFSASTPLRRMKKERRSTIVLRLNAG
jgi:hypothetical protein